MKWILSQEGRPALEALARDRALVAFDYDGTLAPIVDDRTRAELRPETRALLRIVSLLYPTAVVSGRARADVSRRLEGIPLVAFVGSHGAEAGFGPVDRAPRATVAGWRAAVTPLLARAPGVELEDKGLALAFHYRRAPDHDAAARAALELASGLPGARVFGGRDVVNAVPAGAPTKGGAVEELLERTGCRTALYVGDDVTDEDAFRAPGVTVAIRVGEKAGSAAPWYLRSQDDVDELLRALVHERRHLDGRNERVEGLLRAVKR
jgi:trehalose 6-phosphate phosphatase